jgi:hypothetical protein
MDDAQALEFINEFLAVLDENKAFYEAFRRDYYDRPERGPLEDAIKSRMVALRRVAEEVDAGLVGELLTPENMGWEFTNTRSATLKLKGAIEQRERLQTILGPSGPQLAASQLHAWVWDPAARLWDNDHYRAAVQAAVSSIDTQLQAKLGRYDPTGSALIGQAFTLEPPVAGRPRLRFEGLLEESDRYKSALEGASAFGRGCMMAIRNPVSHDPAEMEEQVALEQLAALSVLARWIDEAVVVTA